MVPSVNETSHYFEAYYAAVFDTDRERALGVIDAALAAGRRPEAIIFGVVVPAVERMVTAMVDDAAATLSQHFLASRIAEEVTDRLLPQFEQAPAVAGTVVLGTAAGDFHGLGKKIVRGCLKAKMYEVIDLGINVAAERFVDEAVTRQAAIIGISSMMVHTARGDAGPRRVRQLLRERGLEGRIKLIVGGAPYRFDENLYRAVGADAWADNGISAATTIAGLLRELEP